MKKITNQVLFLIKFRSESLMFKVMLVPVFVRSVHIIQCCFSVSQPCHQVFVLYDVLINLNKCTP